MATKFHCDACGSVHGEPIKETNPYLDEIAIRWPANYAIYRGWKFGTKQMDVCQVCIARIERVLNTELLGRAETPSTGPSSGILQH